MVTHDERLVRKTECQLWIVEDKVYGTPVIKKYTRRVKCFEIVFSAVRLSICPIFFLHTFETARRIKKPVATWHYTLCIYHDFEHCGAPKWAINNWSFYRALWKLTETLMTIRRRFSRPSEKRCNRWKTNYLMIVIDSILLYFISIMFLFIFAPFSIYPCFGDVVVDLLVLC